MKWTTERPRLRGCYWVRIDYPAGFRAQTVIAHMGSGLINHLHGDVGPEGLHDGYDEFEESFFGAKIYYSDSAIEEVENE